MRNQPCRCLLLLGFGIVGFQKIAADLTIEKVAETVHDVIGDLSEDQNDEECSEIFNKMMIDAISDSEIGNVTNLQKTMSKITQDFLLCIFASSLDAGEPEDEQNPDGDEDREILDLENRRARRASDDTYERSFIPGEALDQIHNFHHQPNYEDLSGQLRVNLHEELKYFVRAGLDQEYSQENYANLVKKLLYVLSENMLTADQIPGVNEAIDKQLQPYIANLITVQTTESLRRQFSDESQWSEESDCVIERLEPMIECVYNYVVEFVEIESSLTLNPVADMIWEPFGLRLFDVLERLLVKIIEETPVERSLQGISYVDEIYKVRSALISCLDLLRKQYDAWNRGITTTVTNNRFIDECLNAGMKKVKDLVDFLTHNYGADEIGVTATLDKVATHMIEKIVTDVMVYYSELKDLKYFVRKLIYNGILAGQDDPDRSLAWNVVDEWNQSDIQDANHRLVTMFGDGHLANLICREEYPQNFTTDPDSAASSCWKYVFEDLLILESAIYQDGLSLQVVFFGDPILMNYIYIVDQELAAVSRTKWRNKSPAFRGH